MVPVRIQGDGAEIPGRALDALRVEPGAEVGFTPLSPLVQTTAAARDASAASEGTA
jgi:hypothetical protein